VLAAGGLAGSAAGVAAAPSEAAGLLALLLEETLADLPA